MEIRKIERRRGDIWKPDGRQMLVRADGECFVGYARQDEYGTYFDDVKRKRVWYVDEVESIYVINI